MRIAASASRHARLAAVVLLVVGLHAALLAPARNAERAAPAASRAVAALQVRSLAPEASAATAPPAPPAPRDVIVPPRPAPPRGRPTRGPAPVPAIAAPAPEVEPAPLVPPAQTSTAGAADAPSLPTYATRLPPPGQWRYRMQRGAAVGEAELRFSLDGDPPRYAVQLEGRVGTVTVLDWASRGQLDAAGLAPDRFALRRGGRDRQAANFQREAGKISFSGPTHVQPLPAGAQDRLSWLLQLTAIVDAAPERFGPGASVVLFVAGARGDADLWAFVVEGTERLDGRPLLKLVREPRKLYDVRAEVWLDPARRHLAQRLLQTPSAGGAALDLVLEDSVR